jgi:hypothetical protein
MDATRYDHEHNRTTGWQLEDVLEIATQLVGDDEIGAVHVVVAERPTYDALLRSRRLAEANGLTLTLTADAIVLRPPRQPHAEGTGATSTLVPGPGANQIRAFASGAWRWLRGHARNRGSIGRANLEQHRRGPDHAIPTAPKA